MHLELAVLVTLGTVSVPSLGHVHHLEEMLSPSSEKSYSKGEGIVCITLSFHYLNIEQSAHGPTTDIVVWSFGVPSSENQVQAPILSDSLIMFSLLVHILQDLGINSCLSLPFMRYSCSTVHIFTLKLAERWIQSSTRA